VLHKIYIKSEAGRRGEKKRIKKIAVNCVFILSTNLGCHDNIF
jgi:hypothetical protein